MRTESLQYLIEVANCGSISKASETLFISQPSLSKAIKQLEQELNVTIFERNSSGVALTKAGKHIVTKAQKILADYDELLEFTDTVTAHISLNETLKVGFTEGFSNKLLIDTITTITKKHPSAKIIPLQLSLSESLSAIKNQQINLAILSYPFSPDLAIPDFFSDDTYSFFYIELEPLYTMVHKKSAAYKNKTHDITAISDPYILRSEFIADEFFANSLNLTDADKIFFQNSLSIIEAVNRNLGIVNLSSSIIAENISLISKDVRLISQSNTYNKIFIASNSANPPSKLQKTFLNTYRRQYKKNMLAVETIINSLLDR